LIFAAFVLITWVVICIFTLLPKSLSPVENIILYFLLVMSSTMSTTILALNLNLIVISDRIHIFFCFWLIRTIAIPLILLGGINIFLCYKNCWIKVLVLISCVVIALGIETLSHMKGLVTFTGWNQYYFMILVLFLFGLNYGMAKLLRKIGQGKCRHDDHV
jgi:hypothetical protein